MGKGVDIQDRTIYIEGVPSSNPPSGHQFLYIDPSDKHIKTKDSSGSITEYLPNGVTMVDQWRLTTSFSGNAIPIASNLERSDDAIVSIIGTGMSEASGVFSFPSTGIYIAILTVYFNQDTNEDNAAIGYIEATQDNGTNWDELGALATNLPTTNSTDSQGSVTLISSPIDITDLSNDKLRFIVRTQQTSTKAIGNISRNQTFMTFLRLGDT